MATFAVRLLPWLLAPAAFVHAAGGELACQQLTCSTLIPAPPVDDGTTNDCGYQTRNQWWLDYVAGSLAWRGDGERVPITVAVFDDGAHITHPEVRNRLWTNTAELQGIPGKDDDGNGFVDDLHGWDFVDDDPRVAPEGECSNRPSHGTFMASLIAGERNNGTGIAAAGSEGARVMILRITGCGGEKARMQPQRLLRALDYARRMGARILSFSAHWSVTSAELDAAFEEIAATAPADQAAIIVASVPNKGEPEAGYPAAYPWPRIVRAVPIGNDDIISPGTSPAPAGLNLGAPSACVLGASGESSYAVRQGSSNSTAILAGLLAALWSDARYATFDVDQFLAQVVRTRMMHGPRRSQPQSAYPEGVPLADACVLATPAAQARVCSHPARQQGSSR